MDLHRQASAAAPISTGCTATSNGLEGLVSKHRDTPRTAAVGSTADKNRQHPAFSRVMDY